MWFANAGLLWLGLLAVVPLLLYFFRHRPRTQRVSTLLFFKTLAKEHQESAWMRYLKKLLSLLLTLLILSGAVAGLARLIVAPRQGDLRHVVLVIDRSASMAAEDDAGRTRLDDALAQVRTRLAGLPSGATVAVMAYDHRPEILLPRSMDRREIERALGRIAVRPIEGDAAKAMRLALSLASLEEPAVIWHVTDGPKFDYVHFVAEQASTDDGPLADGESRDVGDEGSAASAGAVDAAGQVDAQPLLDAGPVVLSAEALAALEEGRIRIEHMGVGLREPLNAGVTAFAIRRMPQQPSRYEAFIEVRATVKEPTVGTLALQIDEQPALAWPVEFVPGKPTLLFEPIEAGVGQRMTLSIKLDDAAGRDVLSADDRVFLRIPPLEPLRVAWISADPSYFTGNALRTLDPREVVVTQGGPENWPLRDVDVVIFEGWLPPAWPEDVQVVVINPPSAQLGPVRSVRLDGEGLPIDRIRLTNSEHPLMFGPAAGRISVVQTAALETRGRLEPLWLGPAGPVLAAGEAGRQRIVVMGFDPMASVPGMSEHLGMMMSWPILLGNAIYWAGDSVLSDQSGANHRTGEAVLVSGSELVWETPGDSEREPWIESRTALQTRMVELDRIGLWRSDAADDGGDAAAAESGSASLLSARETMLIGAEASADEGRADSVDAGGGVWAWLGGEQTAVIVWIIACLLLLESWLFHRHAVY